MTYCKYCKYCKKKNHNIDYCPEIICKLCKQYGHPHWKCKLKKKDISVTPIIKENTKENIKENIEEIRHINYFLKYIDSPWETISN